VIAATCRELGRGVASGTFREDLFYRLAVFPVRLPPLRERGDDVLLLADAFVGRFASRHGKRIEALSAAARAAVLRYPWPGNIRELENAVERATILEDGPAIELANLPFAVQRGFEGLPAERPAAAAAPRDAPALPRPRASPPGTTPFTPLEEEERKVVQRALEISGWNIKESASWLGISRTTLYRKIDRYRLAPGGAGADG
jgi:two-component system repressor protein LuxO